MENLFALNVIQMITVHALVNKKNSGCKMFSNNKLMRNGWRFILNYVLGVKKLYKEVQDVILWLVYAARTFVIYAQDPGNQITRIILNVIFTKKALIRVQTEKNRFCKK